MNPLLHPILLCPSPDRWLVSALGALDTLVLDLAHCEKKAASTVVGLIFRLSDHDQVAALSRMAREELSHFEACLRVLEARGLRFDRLEPSAYAGRLAGAARRGGPEALLDAFLIAALIEARSGERLALLEEALPDGDLRRLIQMLRPAEERHVELLLALAESFGPVEPRLSGLAEREADLVRRGEEAIRFHS